MLIHMQKIITQFGGINGANNQKGKRSCHGVKFALDPFDCLIRVKSRLDPFT